MTPHITLPRQVKDIGGQRFGRLAVTRFVETRPTASGRTAFWEAVCDCGSVVVVAGSSLRVGNSSSCGCLARALTAARSTVHGNAGRGRKTTEYTAWNNMKVRCSSPGRWAALYASRGISVCDRWLLGESGLSGFECFLADMGPRPSRRHSLDRIDNDGNYEPSNCRWTTQDVQVRNSRRARVVDVDGQKMCVTDAAQAIGAPYGRLQSRRRMGWSDAAIFQEKRVPARLFVNGAMLTMREAAAISPVGEAGIRKRLASGWSAEAAVLAPRQKTGPKPHLATSPTR